MIRSSIFIFIIFSAVNSFSQAGYPSFGKADINELLLKECPFEKDADAMKLFDLQETEIFINGVDLRIQSERRIRIKIFNKEGFDAANISIPYLQRSKKSKVVDISAYIYNIDSSGNNIVTQKLDNTLVFKEKSKGGISSVNFTFPDVRPGCVIEYRYKHTDNKAFHLDPWFFQDKIPTALSVCKLVYPTRIVVDYRLIGTSEATKDSDNKYLKNIETFTGKQIPAFQEEPMMSSVKDNLQRVEFAFVPYSSAVNILMGANKWDLFTRYLIAAPLFGRQIHNHITGTERILDSAKKISSVDDRVHFIYQGVRNVLKWDNTYSFFPDDLNDIWKDKAANSAEINLSILNLLKKSGIQAYPVLASTRNNGKPDRVFSTLSQFNNLVILIGDTAQFYVVDGTQRYNSYKVPPDNILNRDILMINNDSLKSKWLTLTDKRTLLKTNITAKATLNNESILTGNANISYYDYSKAGKIEEQDKKEKTEDAKEFIEGDVLDVVIDSLIEENASDELLPLVHKFTFTYKLSSTGDYFYLDPLYLSPFRKNPFNYETRHTDIDMGSNQSFKIQLYINFPKNFLVEELPQNILIRSNDSSMVFSREVLHQKNDLLFRCSFEVLRAVYEKEEYPAIKEFFKKMYAVLSDKIVFKRN